MEKMRRARINDSLNELKGLILDLLNKDVSFFFLNFVFTFEVGQVKQTLKTYLNSVSLLITHQRVLFILPGFSIFENGEGRYTRNDRKLSQGFPKERSRATR